MKKYVFIDQMQFLNKTYESRDTADSLENTIYDQDELVEDEQLQTFPEGKGEDTQDRNAEIIPKRRRKPDKIELKMLKALELEKPNSHMSLFQSLMPHLTKFDNNDVLQFQMGVLQLITIHNNSLFLHILETIDLYHRSFQPPQSTGQYYESASNSLASTSIDS